MDGIGPEHVKRCSISLFIRGMQNKTTIYYIYTTIYPWEWLKLKQLIISGVGKDVEQVGYLMSGDSLKVYDWELGCTCTRQDYL